MRRWRACGRAYWRYDMQTKRLLWSMDEMCRLQGRRDGGGVARGGSESGGNYSACTGHCIVRNANWRCCEKLKTLSRNCIIVWWRITVAGGQFRENVSERRSHGSGGCRIAGKTMVCKRDSHIDHLLRVRIFPAISQYWVLVWIRAGYIRFSHRYLVYKIQDIRKC